MPGLECDHLNKVFRNKNSAVNALVDLSLELAPGELAAVIGPSGSGKTTLLRCLAGLESPDSGEIRLNDSSLIPLPAHKRKVSMVFQDPALLPHKTVLENITLPLKLRHAGHDRVAPLLNQLGLEPLSRRLPATLSGGQQQKAALARALAPAPDLLLLDEPLANLDAASRDDVLRVIKNLHRQSRVTTLYVTHDQVEAARLGCRIAVVNNGRVEQFGHARELLETPASLFVGNFFEPGLCLLPGGPEKTLSACRPGAIEFDPAGDYTCFIVDLTDLGMAYEVTFEIEGRFNKAQFKSPPPGIVPGKPARFRASNILRFDRANGKAVASS